MAKSYVLSEADRRLLETALREQRSAPPRPAIVKTPAKEFESADSWWALPPCETGLPRSWIIDGKLNYGVAICCIYKMNSMTEELELVLDTQNAPLRLNINNAYPNVINGLVRIHQDKNGTWSNEPVPVTGNGTTTSTTASPNTTTSVPRLCGGDCLWVSKPLGGGKFGWRLNPENLCANTTTPAPITSAPPPPATSTTTTTRVCTPSKCRLKCVAVTTTLPPGGTTSWPPQPYVPYRYTVVSDLDNQPCAGGCSCYGDGDPCFLLNGEIESKCLYVTPTTSTSTTTTTGLPNRVCDWVLAGIVGPPSPTQYIEASWSDLSNGGWQVCNDCPAGYQPFVRARSGIFSSDDVSEYQDYAADLSFLDITRKDNVGTPENRSFGAWKFSTGCHFSPCSIGPAVSAGANEAEYRTFTKNDIYRYILSDAWNTIGIKWIQDILGSDKVPGSALEPYELDQIWKRLFDELDEIDDKGQRSYRARWSICKSCPSGTRPLVPPSKYVYVLDENTSGQLVEGVWVYKTPCVAGPDCSVCEDIPIVRGNFSAATTIAPGPTTTLPPCGCVPPDYCPSAEGECVRTQCKPGGNNTPPDCNTTAPPNSCYDFVAQKMCVCNTSTTTTTSRPVPSTVPPDCSGNCTWKLVQGPYSGGNTRPGLVWQPVDASCAIERSYWCECGGSPPTTCAASGVDCKPVGNCGDVYSVACQSQPTTTTCQPAPPCPACTNGCYWAANNLGGWQKLYWNDGLPPEVCGATQYWPGSIWFNPDGSNSCPSSGTYGSGYTDGDWFGGPIAPGCSDNCASLVPNRSRPCGPGGRQSRCICAEPNYPPTGCEWMVFTPCKEVTPTECSCCATTSTTPNPCNKSCTYKGDGSNGWTLLTNPCVTSCPCPTPQGASRDSCDRLELKCGSQTTTTLPPGTTTTTTTTTARPQGACCYSAYNPSGCIVTWQLECTQSGGTWYGAGSVCSPNPCPVTTTTTTTTAAPRGACCCQFSGSSLPYTCVDSKTAAECTTYCGAFASYWASGASCSSNPCPTTTASPTTTTTAVPTGRCCLPSGGCMSGQTQAQCTAMGGYSWLQGQTCTSSQCLGACCYTDALGSQCADNMTQSL